MQTIVCRYICDGSWQCPQGEDELSCANHTCAGLFQCKGSKTRVCIYLFSVCDNQSDCESWEDELFCDLQRQCPMTCECLMYAVVCMDVSLFNTITIQPLLLNLMFCKLHNITTKEAGALTLNIKLANMVFFVWKISNLTDICFKNNLVGPKLLSLDFSGNEVPDLGQSCFSHLANLKILNLNDNRLSKISPGAFTSLTKLIVLDISGNELTAFELYIFEQLNLTLLNVTDNSFTTLMDEKGQELKTRILSTDDYWICCALNTSEIICLAKTIWPENCSTLLETMSATIVAGFSFVLAVLLNCGGILGTAAQIQKQKARKFIMKGNIKVATKIKGDFAFKINLLFLHVNDFMTGLHTMSLFCIHNVYGKLFYLQRNFWLGSIYCRMLGVLSALLYIVSLFLLHFLTATRFIVVMFPFKTTFKRQKPVLQYLNCGILCSFLFCVVYSTIIFLVDHQDEMPSPVCSLTGETVSSTLVKSFAITLVVFRCTTLVSIFVLQILVSRNLQEQQQSNLGKSKSETQTKATVQFVCLSCCYALSWCTSSAFSLTSVSMVTYPTELLVWNAVLIQPLLSVTNPLIFFFWPLLQSYRKKLGHRTSAQGKEPMKIQ